MATTDSAANSDHVLQQTPQPCNYSLLSLYSSTLLSTNRLNKLLHLTLSVLVHSDAALFTRAMLFLYNERTEILQGMLGVTRADSAGLKIVEQDPENPLTGHWEMDEAEIEIQWQSDYCSAVRSMRIDIREGCSIVAQALKNRRLCYVGDVNCLLCDNCGFTHKLKINSFAAAPLISHGNMIGILIVDCGEERLSVNSEQLQLLQLFAMQAGMAIENSQLYRNLQDMHNELRDSRQRLVHSAHLAAVGEMAATIAHELKNPLVTIGGFASRLQKQIPKDAPYRNYLETIISESRRLEQMLADLLNYSRKPVICYSRFDLLDILNECISDYATRFAENNIKLNLSLPSGNWETLADQNQLKQVFINLLVNAQEAMPNGGSLSISLSRPENNENNSVCIVFSDNGGGIPPEIIGKVFVPFFTTKRHGTGLGLPIVNRIIKNHGGTLKAANNGHGAEFTITLPLKDHTDNNTGL